MVIKIRSQRGSGRFFGRSKLSKAVNIVKPPPTGNAKLRRVVLKTVKTTALTTAPPVKG